MSRQISDGFNLPDAICAAKSDVSSIEFGTGALGDVTITGVVEMVGELHYNNLTIASTGALVATAQRILIVRVLGDLVIESGGAIHADGRGFAGLPGGAGGAASAVVGNGANGMFGASASTALVSAAGGGGGASGGGGDWGSSDQSAGFGASGGHGATRTAIDNNGGGLGGVFADVGGNDGGPAGPVSALDSAYKTPLLDDLTKSRGRWLFGGPGGSGAGGGGGVVDIPTSITPGGSGGLPGAQVGTALGHGQPGTSQTGVHGAYGGAGGGASGAGGGVVEVWVKGSVIIQVGGRITARGGQGGPGGSYTGGTGNGQQAAGGSGGGGGGGGGGTVLLIHRGPASIAGEIDATGGAGGIGGAAAVAENADGGAGGNGSAGEDGFVLVRQVA